MFNELIFIVSCVVTAVLTLGSLMLGAEGLVAAVCVQGILENIFVVKQMELFGLHVTCADVFAVGLVFGLNLLQEFYGKKSSGKAIWAYFLVSVWFLAARTAHVWYVPSVHDITHPHFVKVLESSPRLIIASLVTSLAALHLDRYVYARIRNFFGGRWVWMSNVSSIALSQLFDTVLFTYLGLYGTVSSPLSIIAVSYAVKLVAITLTGPFAAIARPLHVLVLARRTSPDTSQ